MKHSRGRAIKALVLTEFIPTAAHAGIAIICALFVSALFGCSNLKGERPRSPSPDQIRIAFGSCIDTAASPIWDAIRKTSPTLMMLLGDTIYIQPHEHGNAAALSARYHQLTREPAFARLRREVPLYAIWDDHDFGRNDSDSRHPERDVAAAVFREVWPDHPPQPAGLENSIAFAHSLPGLRLLALDDRTYRVNPSRGNHGTMFGEAQLRWLEGELSAPKTPLVVLANGNQILPRQRDSVEGLSQFPLEWERVRRAIVASPALVVIISGDRHFAEVLQFNEGGRTVIEVTSSPLTARNADPEYLEGRAGFRGAVLGTHNFGLLTIDRSETSVTLRADIRDDDGRTILHFEWPEILQSAPRPLPRG